MYISRLLTQPLQQLKLTLKTSPQVPQTFLLFYISAFIVREVFIFDQVETPPITTGFLLRIGRLLIFFSAERLTQTTLSAPISAKIQHGISFCFLPSLFIYFDNIYKVQQKRSELKCREKSGHAKSTEWYYVLLCRCFSLGPRCVFMKSGIGGEWENSGLVNLVQERTLGTRLRYCERLYEVWARFLERWLILTQE